MLLVVEALTAKRLVAVAFANVAFVPVRSVIQALVSVAPVAERLVVEAFASVAVPVAIMLATVKPLAERMEVEAFVAVRPPMNAEVKVAPVAERFVVDANEEKRLVAVAKVAKN